ncbi:hypothetical protein [Stenotrophomonas rhizophila]|uniref:hypothetical protein n=1 Tax=Stenotrophomonas rhizophila TaxID=216778 RepID=UPI0011CD49FC|nr:hypothetical protein [Stenotrophomonas rhizophila]
MAGRLRNHLRGLQLMRAALRVMLTLFILAGVYTGGGAGIDRAQAAQQCAYPNGGYLNCDQGMAYAECALALSDSRAWLAANPAGSNVGGPGNIVDACTPGTQGSSLRTFRCSYKGYGAGATVACRGLTSATSAYPIAKTCDKRDAYTGVGPWSSGGKARNGSMGCQNGCDGVWYSNSDGSMTFNSVGGTCKEDEKGTCEHYGEGFYWNALLKVCEPPEGKCPGNSKANSLGKCEPEPCPDGKVLQQDGTCKTKESECPAGNIKSPDGKCLPGEGQCAQGEARGKDGTCKKDSDGDGQPDEESGEPGEKEPDSFSGGDDCKTPPSCSGSAILCGQARIQWRIDCNTRRNRNIAGGQCNAQPICTGDKCDAMEYTSLLMQWRTACALEKASGGSGDNGDLAAIRNALTGTGGSVNPGTLPGSDAWVTGTGQPTKPNTAGYGWSGSCPAIPAVSFMGTSIQIDATPICNWLSLGSFFVMGLAALGSLRIVATKDS